MATLWGVRPAIQLYRFAHPALRAAAVERARGMRFRTAALKWDDERRRAATLERLRFVVRRAAREVPYYRELFASAGFDPAADFSFADYARLPVLERDEVRSVGKGLVSTAVDARQVRREATGGSTGTPTEIWTGPEERGWREGAFEFFMTRIGVPPGARTALLWAHHLDPVARSSFRDRLHDTLENTEWLDCLRLSPEVLLRYDDQMTRTPPACIIAYASALDALASAVADAGRTPAYPRVCFVTGAEKLYPAQRARIEEVFRRPVYERYGSRDVGIVAFQVNTGADAALEVDWGNVLVEPETSDPFPSILITKLRADAMPMLRYRIGDVARFPRGSRPGEPAFRLHEVMGRETDRVCLPDGRWVHGIGFPHLFKDYPIRDFQVVQRADYSILVRVVPLEGFDDSARRQILEVIEANLPGLRSEIQLDSAIERTASNKWRPVISEVVTMRGGAER